MSLAKLKKRIQTEIISFNDDQQEQHDIGYLAALGHILEWIDEYKVNPKPRKCKYEKWDYAAAYTMHRIILRKFEKMKEPNLKNWAEDIRKMREIDNRGKSDIHDIFIWANNHEFWSSQILSPENMRKHFDRMAAQKQTGQDNGRNPHL